MQAAGEMVVRPNIIFILADDVSADELAPYGGTIAMPNLQKLADDGVLFRNAWATPVCAPSRAMFMTGKYPHHTGYYENPVSPEVSFWRDPRHLPVLKMMKQAGYATSMIGKIHPGNISDVSMLGAEDSLITWFWPGARWLAAKPLGARPERLVWRLLVLAPRIGTERKRCADHARGFRARPGVEASLGVHRGRSRPAFPGLLGHQSSAQGA